MSSELKSKIESATSQYYFGKYKEGSVVVQNPVEKKPKDAEATYNSFVLNRNMGTDGAHVLKECLIEGPIMEFSGISRRENPMNKRNEVTIVGRYDPLENKEHGEWIKFCDEIFRGDIAKQLRPHAAVIGANLSEDDFDTPAGFGRIIKSVIYRPRDKKTKKLIKGAAPCNYFKLNEFYTSKTNFFGLNGKAIDWSLLENVKMRGRPLILFKSVYANGQDKAPIQFELRSVQLTQVPIAVNSENLQKETLQGMGLTREQEEDFERGMRELANKTKANDIFSDDNTKTIMPKEDSGEEKKTKNDTGKSDIPLITGKVTAPSSMQDNVKDFINATKSKKTKVKAKEIVDDE